VQCPFCPSSAPIKGSFPPSCLPSTPPCLLSAGKATAASSSVLVVAAHRGQPSSPPFPPSLQVPGAPLCPEAAPRPLGASPSTSESHRAVAAMVTFHLDIVPLPRCISRAKTLSRHRVVAHGRAPRESSRRPSSRRPSPRAPRASCARRRGPSTRCATAAPGQATPHRRLAAQAARTVRVGRPRWFRPVYSFLNRNPFLFILNSFQIQTLKIHI
jgi:hypothetical protein